MNSVKGKLTLFPTILLIVGGMIGSAIFSLSGLTIFYAGPSAILAWIIAAIIQLFFGLAMAELATRYSKSGGLFVFPEQTFKKNGELVGFISTWSNSFADLTAVAFSAIYVSIYLVASFPNLAKYSVVISIAAIIFCWLLNCLNLSTTGKINNVLVILFIVILALYVVLVFSSGNFDAKNLTPFFGQGSEKLGLLKAIPIAMIGYSSIIAISSLAGEIDKPQKNIPLSVSIGLLIVVTIYSVVILATVGAITGKELSDSNMVYIPLYAVCFTKLTEYPILSYFVTIAAVLALLTTMLLVIAMNGRTIKAIADNNLLPKKLSLLGKNGTPIFAMTTICLLAAILAAFKDIADVMVNLAALFAVITRIINFITLYYSRKISGNNASYRAPIPTILIFILILILILCYIPDITKGGAVIWLVTAIWIIIGYFVYMYFNKRRLKNG